MADKYCEHCFAPLYDLGPCGCPEDPREAFAELDLSPLSDQEFDQLTNAIHVALSECIAKRDIPSVIVSINKERDRRSDPHYVKI